MHPIRQVSLISRMEMMPAWKSSNNYMTLLDYLKRWTILIITTKSFEKIAEVELSYRKLENNPKLIFEECETNIFMLGNKRYGRQWSI